MARPRNADAARTRQSILDAAMRRFGERGVGGTSVRDIATDAGVSFATVHHYFGSKQALFDVCMEEAHAELEGLRHTLAEELRGTTTDAERVERVARAAFRYALAHRRESRFLLRATLFETEVPDRARLETAQQRYLGIASNVLGPLLGRDPAALRVPLQGLMFLLTRLALATERELEIIGGDAIDTRDALEDYVGEVAVATLVRAA